MATYKIVNSEQLDADLTTLADAIRAKCGTTDTLSFPDGMKSAVEAMSTVDIGSLKVLFGGTYYLTRAIPSGYSEYLDDSGTYSVSTDISGTYYGSWSGGDPCTFDSITISGQHSVGGYAFIQLHENGSVKHSIGDYWSWSPSSTERFVFDDNVVVDAEFYTYFASMTTKVEEVSYTILAGTYKVADSPDYWMYDESSNLVSTSQAITFTSNGSTFAFISAPQPADKCIYYGSTQVYGNGWLDTAYQTITLESDQSVSYALFKWWLENVTKQ